LTNKNVKKLQKTPNSTGKTKKDRNGFVCRFSTISSIDEISQPKTNPNGRVIIIIGPIACIISCVMVKALSLPFPVLSGLTISLSGPLHELDTLPAESGSDCASLPLFLPGL
jgi:hypothetical protein